MATSSGKPEKKAKSTLQRDEKGKEELLEAARKRVECERRAMKIVERLLEDSISESFFEDCGKYITSKQFEDVAVERAIEKLCGYPLCTNKLINIPRQQYHISLKSKKVFDITERKNFCSQRCFQAHKYYQTQLNDEPLWTRDHKRMPPVKLFEHDTNAVADHARLKPQNEIPMKAEITSPKANTVQERTAEGAVTEEEGLHAGVSRVSLDNVKEKVDGAERDGDKKREEMLRRIAESVARPARSGRKEVVAGSGSHVRVPSSTDEPSSSDCVGREQGGVKYAVTPEALHPSSRSQGKPVQTISDGSLVSEHCVMPDNENSHRDGMQQTNQIEPVQTGSEGSKSSPNLEPGIALEESKRNDKLRSVAVQADDHGMTVKSEKSHEIQQEQTVSSKDRRTCGEKKKKKRKKKSPAAENPMRVILQHIQQCLLEWRTEKTIRHIYGKSTFMSGNKNGTDVTSPNEDDNRESEKKDLQEFEKRVGERLDREELREGAFPVPSKPLPDYNQLRREEEEKYALKVKEFFMGRDMTAPSLPETEMQEKPIQPPVNPIDRTEGLPPVDSRAQVTIRRKILLDRLSKILPGIAVSLHLSVHEVNPMITDLVRTFQPGSHNIVFKPVAWTLLAVVLIHILAEKEASIRESLESDHSVAFLTSMLNQLGLKVDAIQGSVKNFKQGAPS